MPGISYKNKVHKEVPPEKTSKPGPKPKKKRKPKEEEPKKKKSQKVKGTNPIDLPEDRNFNRFIVAFQKTFPNYKGLNEQEFYKALAQWADMYDKQRMERYTKAFAEVLIHELVFAEELRVPYLGTFTISKYKGYEYTTKENGKNVKVKVPSRFIPIFVPCDSLVNDVNNEYTTKEYKKRKKDGELTWRDYTRDMRREMWEAEKRAEENDTPDNQKLVEKLHKKFRQALDTNDVRGLEKITDISDKREEQLKIKKEKQKKEQEEDE